MKKNNYESLSYKYANMMDYYDKIKDIRQTVLDNASIDDVNFGMYKNVIFNYFYEILKKANIIFDKKVIQEKEILLTKKIYEKWF